MSHRWHTTACVLVTLLAFAAAAVPSLAQGPMVSAPISDVYYQVRADSASVATRHIAVTMTFNVASTAPVALALPAWSPGHYTLLWFARRVSHLTVSEASTPLTWHKLDYQTWQIVPRSPGQISVSFDYLADAVDRAVAWTSPSFAFFNGTNVFMYPAGRGFDWPATVSVVTEPSWRVTTGMMPTTTSSATPHTFSATNYHDLVDMPFWVGRFDLDSTRVVNRWIRLAMYPAGSMTRARRDTTFNWLQRFIPAEAAVFRDVPFRNYTVFLLSDTVVNGGGLEHQSSQMDELPTSRLDDPRNASLFSHEFFHAWNVKRLRPVEMVPYRYADTDPTQWLWVSEGITDYYAQIALVRSRVTDSTAFLNAMSNNIASIETAPPTALSDASLSAWIAPTNGSAGLYYPKGAIAGFLLDIMIRDASNNSKSLDDVMRALYQTTYKQGRGFTRNDWWSEVSRAAGGRSFDDFARRYVDGRDPMPFESVLPLAGLRLVRDSAAATPRARERIVPIENATAKAVRIRNGIMHGSAGVTRER